MRVIAQSYSHVSSETFLLQRQGNTEICIGVYRSSITEVVVNLALEIRGYRPQ